MSAWHTAYLAEVIGVSSGKVGDTQREYTYMKCRRLPALLILIDTSLQYDWLRRRLRNAFGRKSEKEDEGMPVYPTARGYAPMSLCLKMTPRLQCVVATLVIWATQQTAAAVEDVMARIDCSLELYREFAPNSRLNCIYDSLGLR
jgi:hypothetical protein